MSEEERVRLIAYRMWEQEGRPQGQALDHWLRAEAVRAEEKEFEDHLAKDVEGCALCT